MRVCVYGAGAVGTCLAARLHGGGADVSIIARGATLAAIRAGGITMQAPRREISAAIPVTEAPGELGPQDAVIVAVKAPALPAVAAGLAPLLGPETVVAFVMNGIPWWYFQRHGGELEGRKLPRIDPDDVVLRTVGTERVAGGVIYCACDTVAPGVVHVETAHGRLVLGRPDGRISDGLEALAVAMRDDDFTVEVTPHIRRTIWAKLQMNICSGLFGSLANSAPKWIYAEPACEAAVRKLVAEAGAIAEAMGCPTGFDADKLFAMVRNLEHKASIAQDLDKGRPMEFDAMFGAPLEFAQLMKVPAPTLELLTALVKIRAREAGCYQG